MLWECEMGWDRLGDRLEVGGSAPAQAMMDEQLEEHTRFALKMLLLACLATPVLLIGMARVVLPRLFGQRCFFARAPGRSV